METPLHQSTFTESLSRLREIVSTIENNSPDVDELILLAEEAVELIGFCRSKLTTTEEKVSSMLEKLSQSSESQEDSLTTKEQAEENPLQ